MTQLVLAVLLLGVSVGWWRDRARRKVGRTATPVRATPATPGPGWETWEYSELRARREESDDPWLEFLRVPSLYAGVYEIPRGGTDGQEPHRYDELYHIVSGTATIVVDGERRPVEAGSVIYVAAEVPHHFQDISEDLSVLVFFSLAEPT